MEFDENQIPNTFLLINLSKMKNLFILSIALFTILQSCSNKENISKLQRPNLLSDTNTKASCVFLTCDQHKNPVISWVEIDSNGVKHFYFANWNNQRNSFSPSITIPVLSNTSIHEEGMPKIALKGNDTIVATFETSVPVKNMRFGLSDIHYEISFNKGKTWTTPKPIESDSSHIGSRSFGNIIRLSDGAIGITWLGTDPNNADHARPVYFAKSNGNKGFGKPILIENAGCQCCRTALSTDERGHINVVFRDLLPGSVRDIGISSSVDNGQSFSKPISFSNDHWVIDGCPHDGPSIVSKDDKKYIAWFTGAQKYGVFYAELDKNNQMVTKRQLNPNGRFVQLCLMPDGERIAVYNVEYQQKDSFYSKIIVNKINDKGLFEKVITLPNVNASYPVVQAMGDQRIIVAWTDNNRIYYKLLNIASITEIPAENNTEEVIPFKRPREMPKMALSKDPVCGMKINEKTAMDTTLEHGKIIGFCSQKCKETFLQTAEARR